jgi:3-hydroxyacyl-[acyl-carrier-protein] dehydratase
MTEPSTLDINGIMKYLPHRYPFLLVDRVLEFVSGQRIRAVKNVTYNEPYFMGHFPHRPLMPGVIILEALAQAAGLLAFLTANVIPDENTRFYFVGIDKARFRKPVEPGDQLLLIVELERNFKGIYRFAARAEVGGEDVAHAQIMIAPDLQSVPGTNTTAELP